jgi:hypothetical protein
MLVVGCVTWNRQSSIDENTNVSDGIVLIQRVSGWNISTTWNDDVLELSADEQVLDIIKVVVILTSYDVPRIMLQCESTASVIDSLETRQNHDLLVYSIREQPSNR